jgi:Protein of unknown function (DUF3995)
MRKPPGPVGAPNASSSSARSAAPRWAGYAAALLGLEYAVAKTVMAARGELGLPGHPAPPEAYERFSGDVVAAQLGNAALGLLLTALALALVQRWGRRVPAAVLAAGAVVALVSGIAGAVVVVTSLTGLREDHGQWGIDSLVLGVASLVVWLVLTVAALRAARAEGLPPRVVAVLARGRRAIRGASRPGRRAALAAAVGCAAYGALKLYWAVGGELLLRETPLPADARRDLLERTSGAVAGHWAAVALAAIGIAVAVATVRDRRLPRLVVVGVPALVGGLMVGRAAWGAASDVAVLTGAGDGSAYTARWDLALWSPFFAAWGAAWGLAALAARRRTAGQLGRHPLVRVSSVTVAWAVVFAVVHAYWAAGGEAGMRGDPADSPVAQIYIGAIAALGLVGAALAYGLDDRRRTARRSRTLTLLARAGGAVLLLGVAVGTGRWLAAWSLEGDGPAGIVTTLYFLLGGLLFTALGWRRDTPGPDRARQRRAGGQPAPAK